MSSLLIIGAGGHARVITDILRARGELDRLSGFIDEALPIGSCPSGWDAAIVGRDKNLADHAGSDFIIGIGSISGGNALRAKLFDKAKSAGLQPATLIHPAATLAADVKIGAGTAVMAGVVVNTGSLIGENVILNTRSTLDHDAHIGDHAHIAPGATLSGDCVVGQTALIGVGATLRQGINIGVGATVAAGSVVIGPVADGATVMGVPARVRR